MLKKNVENVRFIQDTMLNNVDKWLEPKIDTILFEKDILVSHLQNFCNRLVLVCDFHVFLLYYTIFVQQSLILQKY